MHYDLVLRGGILVLPWGEVVGDVGVIGGRIVAVGVVGGSAEREVGVGGLHVLPGLIDPHVHFRDPGDAGVETMGTGTRGAVLGGVAAVFDMPNTQPSVVDAGMLAWKRGHVEAVAWCDVGMYVGASRGNIGQLGGLERGRGVCGVKVFAGSSTGDLLIEDDAGLEAVMRDGRRRVSYHSEDEYRLRERRALFAGRRDYAAHGEWRDEEAAFLGTRRIVGLAERTGRPAHILHVSTAEELEWLREHRDAATVEVLVNHLTQVVPEAYERLGGMAVMNPPLRGERHRAAAWAAVGDGRVDTVGSDHAPHSRAAKERAWPEVAAGLTGVQTIVPVMLEQVSAGRLSLGRLVDLMCAGPARVYGVVGKGRIAAGYDGDFTIVDMGRRRTIEEGWIVSPSGWTPFAGMVCRGWPVGTVVRGRVVMWEDRVEGEPMGRLVRFAGEEAGDGRVV